MADKKPLYIENGRIQEYGPGDTISAVIAPGSGGGGGSGGGMSPFWAVEPAVPQVSDYTMLTAPGVTNPQMAQTTRGIYLGCDSANADRMVVAERSLDPSKGWSYKAMLSPAIGNRAYLSYGLYIRDSSTGRIQEFCVAGDGRSVRVFNWSGLGSFSSNPYFDNGDTFPTFPFWIRIEKSGTNILFDGSRDGEFFFRITTVALTSWVTNADRIGLVHVANLYAAPTNIYSGTHFMAAELVNS